MKKGCTIFTVVLLMVAAGLFFWEAGEALATTSESAEETIDSRLGLLKRPWKIGLVRIATRDYLRRQAIASSGWLPDPYHLSSSLRGMLNANVQTKDPANPYVTIPVTSSAGTAFGMPANQVSNASETDSTPEPTVAAATAPSSPTEVGVTVAPPVPVEVGVTVSPAPPSTPTGFGLTSDPPEGCCLLTGTDGG